LNDFKTFGFILYAARNRYRDNELNILGAGEKVRKIIDKYVTSLGIDPSVPPISILDKNFDEFLNGQKSGKTKASEMEHAIRYHITNHYEDDPEFYKDLSEKLEDLIKEQKENWDKLASDLNGLLEHIRAGRGDELVEGIVDKRQMPFYDIIKNDICTD
jgi:type I restriction enzyme R subunit